MRTLEDTTLVTIPATAVFECELSRENVHTKWLFMGKPIQKDGRHEFIHDGTVHKLLVHNVDAKDVGMFTVIARGKKSEAELYIEGK